MTFPVIPAKAGIQTPLEADIASILGSSLRQSDEIGLLSCLIIKCQHYLASRRTFIYGYAARKHYELKFAGLADDVFGRIRSSVDSSIGIAVPDAVKKLTAIYDNLKSDNPEDWANAAHSCRRVLQDLADAIFPAQVETRTKDVNGKEIKIKLGAEHYINRLVAYVEDSSDLATPMLPLLQACRYYRHVDWS